MKPTSTLDVEVLLSDVVGDNKTLMRHVDVFQEKGKRVALVKPKHHMSHTIWMLIHQKVKEWGGKWSSKQRLWEVPIPFVPPEQREV